MSKLANVRGDIRNTAVRIAADTPIIQLESHCLKSNMMPGLAQYRVYVIMRGRRAVRTNDRLLSGRLLQDEKFGKVKAAFRSHTCHVIVATLSICFDSLITVRAVGGGRCCRAVLRCCSCGRTGCIGGTRGIRQVGIIILICTGQSKNIDVDGRQPCTRSMC